MNRPMHARRCRGDAGQVTAMWVVLATALFLLGAVVYGGGTILAGRRDAQNLALQAARAGAQAVDPAAIRTNQPALTLQPTDATAAVHRYLATRQLTPTAVTVSGDQVTVTVTFDQPTPILSIIGIHQRTVTATASARAHRAPT
jgi:hypothetical protein